MDEEWRDIVGYEGDYQVSSDGRIRSFKHKKDGKLMSQFDDKDGYKEIALYKSDVETKRKMHRLVAQIFIPNPNNLPQVNHKNGRKDDNRATNLEWANSSHNMLHSFHVLGHQSPDVNGIKNGRNKLSLHDVNLIFHMYHCGERTFKEIASKFGVRSTVVANILNGKLWSFTDFEYPLIESGTRFKPCEIDYIIQLWECGIKKNVIAKMFLTNVPVIRKIINLHRRTLAPI